MKNQLLAFVRTLANPRSWAYGLFWSWNIIFVAFMVLGFAPNVLPELFDAVRTNTIPVLFLLFGATLTAIPLIAVIIGLTVLRQSPGHLLAMGYAVQGPLMFILTVRFFLIREATLAVNVLMLIAALGLATLLWQLLDRKIDERGTLLTFLRMMGLSLFLVIVLYGCLWLAIYALPLARQLLNELGNVLGNIGYWITTFDWRSLERIQWGMVPFTLLGTLLFLYTATLFVGAPIAVPVIAIWAYRRGAQTFAARFGVLQTIAVTAIVLLVCVATFVFINQQPQHTAFALLKTPPTNVAQAQTIRQNENTIRTGLLNTYLAPYRYFSSVGDVLFVENMYIWGMGFSRDQARAVAQFHDILARPLLYEPVNPPKPDAADGSVLRQEPLEAAQLYKAYFDERITDGEHDTVVNTVRSTWQFSQAEAAWQAVDDRRIHLNRQEITIQENGDWADVELYEVYENQTNEMQEVVYYFALPESAVITGLWLGNSDDRSARFVYRVSPRGAAQELYRNQVQRWQDPALVEQIGPRQYRLRIFPVERRRWVPDGAGRATIQAGASMHMWLTYRVLANNNTWALPRLAEKRNVYWDTATVRLLNGKPMSPSAQDWLPAFITATTPIKPVAHRFEFASGETIIAQPMPANDLPKLGNNLRLAIVLDRSRSMNKFAAEVKTTLTRLSQIAGATTDVYLTASPYRGEAPSRIGMAQLNPNSLDYVGGQNPGELLAQFESLRAGQTYDAILVITDGSGYELGASRVPVPKPNAPVWMIHLGTIPLGYDDATLEAIQASGGGVSNNIEEALSRLAVALNPKGLGVSESAVALDWVDGYLWQTFPSRATSAIASNASNDDFAPFAARRLILSETQRQRNTLGQLTTLDQLHAIAVKHSVVTPYSSMIVVVNAQQERLLQQLENQSDRFQREMEEVGNTNPWNITGVPEPEEWLLIALAFAMLMGYVYKTRVASAHA